jgi:hypothetical protein
MTYNNLTIHQKISLKGLISSRKERIDIGVNNDAYFDGLYALAILNKNYIESINLYLNNT